MTDRLLPPAPVDRENYRVPPPPDWVPMTPDVMRRPTLWLFEEKVEQQGARIAVKDDSASLSYRALNTAANNLAAVLPAPTGPAETTIALLLGHDVWSCIGILGAIKAGRPYVFMEHGSPAARIQDILEDAGSDCLITSREHQPIVEALRRARGLPILYIDELDLAAPAGNPGIYPQADAMCGIFYTSGSTGEPKGLVYSHRALMKIVERLFNTACFSSSDLIGQLTYGHTAAGGANLLAALSSGSTLRMFDMLAHGPQAAVEWLKGEEITLVRMTTALMRSIFERLGPDEVLPALRCLRIGGEAVNDSDIALFRAHTRTDAHLIHSLGSTDVGAISAFIIGHDTPIEPGTQPVGYPEAGLDVMLLADEGRPVPAGVGGEIVVRTDTGASGFWRDPALTATRFRPDPGHPGMLVIHTGDMGRMRPDGMLEFLGRKDFMVKIRGQRVELGEVERALLAHPNIRDAVVVARPSRIRDDQLQLAAYLVQESEAAVTTGELRTYLSALLPEFMIPSYFVFLAALPVGVSGKVDRSALPEPPEREELSSEELPQDDIERRLVEIWRASLKTERVGVRDNYFERGGDSLAVLSMLLDVEQAFGRGVPQSFFREPTIRGLAALLRRGPEEREHGPDFRLQGYRERPPGRMVRLPGILGRTAFRVKRWARNLRRTRDAGYYFESLLAPFLLRMEFKRALRQVQRLASQRWVQAGVYRRQRGLFRRFAASMGLPHRQAAARFGASVVANLTMKLDQGREPLKGSRRSRLRRERRGLVGDLPLERLDAVFPLKGFEHLQAAHSAGRGVILVGLHGTALHAGAKQAIARRTGLDSIPTIARRMPHQQSYLWGAGFGHRVPVDVRDALQAEIAFHGQQLLRQGRIVQILPDVIGGGPGTLPVIIGDRVYSLRPGFAELALNTAAAVVPAFGRFLEDGRLLTEFRSPLEAGQGTREQQVRSLLQAYAAFVTDVCRHMPEIVLWKKMRNHLKWPRADQREPGDRLSSATEDA